MDGGEKTREELLAELAALRKVVDSYKSGRKLRESEETARALLNAPPDSALLVEPDGTIVTLNDFAARRFGSTVAELQGQSVFQFFPPDVIDQRTPFGEEVMRTGKPVRQVDQRGGRWFDYTIYPIHDAAGERVVRFAIYARDITEQREMESALLESEEKYRSLVEQSQQGISVMAGGSFEFVNNAFARMLGYTVPELMALDDDEIRATIHPDDQKMMYEQLQALLAGEVEPSTHDFRFVRKDGMSRWGRLSTSVIDFHGKRAVQGIVLDIDDSKRLEQRIAQAARLEAVGRLAGGVAHDFNNLLTAILGYSKSMVKKMRQEDPLWESAQEISYAADRASALTKQLLAFSREQRMKPRPFNINDVVHDMENMLSSLIGTRIRVEIRLSVGLGVVKVDPGQVEQVLMNLVLNARDAMADGGTLTIETSQVELDADALRGNPDARPGSYILLAVRDTGVGLDEKQQRHIFDPFFSTKGFAEGTGLGLAVVYGIVRQHNGVITVQSEKGRGSCFCVYLPLAAEEPAADGESHPAPPSARAGKRVLVVEDEMVVQRFMASILREFDFEVEVAASAEEAEVNFGHERNRFDLLLADIMLPGRSGIHLAKSFTEDHPNLAVVLTSGYAVKEADLNIVRMKTYQYLQKPFSEEELISSVRLALEQVSPDSSIE